MPLITPTDKQFVSDMMCNYGLQPIAQIYDPAPYHATARHIHVSAKLNHDICELTSDIKLLVEWRELYISGKLHMQLDKYNKPHEQEIITIYKATYAICIARISELTQ